MDLIGIGIITLVIYIAAILVINVVLKRKMSEAMLWTFILIVAIGAIFGGQNAFRLGSDGIKDAAKNEVVYASMAFIFMAFIMEKTGVINRLIQILNSVLGRFPGGSGYVSTVASALFGMVSGSGSGNASAVGSITIPWMKGSGWTTARATTIVAGNAGLGIVFPPSTSMLMLLGMETIAVELTSNELYVGLMGAAVIVLAYRLFVVYLYAKSDGLAPLPKERIFPLAKTLKENYGSFVIFLGIAIPLIFTMGPSGSAIKEALNASAKGAFKSISLVMWIPVLMIFFTMVEGWKSLPHTFKGWKDLIESSVGHFSEVGCQLFFSFASASVLSDLGIQKEFTAIFNVLGSYSPVLVMIVVAVVLTLMVAPFSGTATTAALGALCYAALRSIGLPPVTCCVAFLFLISNEGCTPPQAAPIYIASGIAGLEDPACIFKDLLFHFATPVIVIAMLIMLGIIPIIGA